METHQHLALLRHEAHRQPRSVAIAPSGALDRPEHLIGRDLGQVPQTILERALLGRQLGTGLQVLHLAATACSDIPAARSDALRTLAAHRGDRGLLPLVLAAENADLNLFTGQRALDEHDLALGVVGHALPLEIEGLDAQPFGACCHHTII